MDLADLAIAALKKVLIANIFMFAILIGLLIALKLLGVDKAAVKITAAARGRFANTRIGRRMAIRRKGKEAFEERQAMDDESRMASGNYRKTWANPLNWTKNVRSATNAARIRYGLGTKYTGDQVVAERARRDKERATVISEFGDNTNLARAWIESRGGRDTSSGAYGALGEAEKGTIQLMRMGGRHQSSESFRAAQQMLSAAGEGDFQTLLDAQAAAKAAGASQADLEAMGVGSVTAWRGAGRGDLGSAAVAALPEMPAGVPKQGTGGWSSIDSLEALSRHAFTDFRDPNARVDNDKLKSFAAWAGPVDAPNRRRILLAYPKMKGRTADRVAAALKGWDGNPGTFEAAATAGRKMIADERDALGMTS